ncbi:hypothetical protein, partial [Microvirga puerhi]
MANTPFSKVLDEKITQIEQIAAAIAEDAEDGELRELRNVLLGIAGVIERDPGIEMASDDLYAAASVAVSDSISGTRPYMRKRRLLESASCRLVGRLRRYRDDAVEAEALEALAQDGVVSAA